MGRRVLSFVARTFKNSLLRKAIRNWSPHVRETPEKCLTCFENETSPQNVNQFKHQMFEHPKNNLPQGSQSKKKHDIVPVASSFPEK